MTLTLQAEGVGQFGAGFGQKTALLFLHEFGVFGFIHRRACRLGSQTTNRTFNYAGDIPSINQF